MTLRVTVIDVETGDTDTAEVVEGNYLLICHKPCYEASVQTYPTKGTHVLTIKGHRPKLSTVGVSAPQDASTVGPAGIDPPSASTADDTGGGR